MNNDDIAKFLAHLTPEQQAVAVLKDIRDRLDTLVAWVQSQDISGPPSGELKAMFKDITPTPTPLLAKLANKGKQK